MNVKIDENVPEEINSKPDLDKEIQSDDQGKKAYLSRNNEEIIINVNSNDHLLSIGGDHTVSRSVSRAEEESLIFKLLTKNEYNDLDYFSKQMNSNFTEMSNDTLEEFIDFNFQNSKFKYKTDMILLNNSELNHHLTTFLDILSVSIQQHARQSELKSLNLLGLTQEDSDTINNLINVNKCVNWSEIHGILKRSYKVLQFATQEIQGKKIENALLIVKLRNSNVKKTGLSNSTINEQPANSSMVRSTIVKESKNYKIFAITCIDQRCHDVVRAQLDREGHAGSHDVISMAGADLCLAHKDCPDAWLATLTDNLAIGVALHDIKEIWVFAHQDCGACKKFGLLKPTMCLAQERAMHLELSKASNEELSKLFPDVKLRHQFVKKSDVSGNFDDLEKLI